ncbi:PDZ domain protein [Hydrogenophaga sp. RAC07]|nr:PDZ domain protein [Hydrogenophaga sp. RAC07]
MLMGTVRNALFAVCVASLSGCATGYKDFYKPVAGATPERVASTRVAPPPAVPVVERIASSDMQAVADQYTKRGYGLIGTSVFNSGRRETEDAAIQQGAEVKADLVVILNPRFTGSVTTAMPITVPKTTTSYSSGTATAFGPRGPVTAYGSGTTTTYGTSTTFVPVTVNRMDFGAAYFVKRKWSFGLEPRELTDQERQALQSNRGVAVRLIVDGTPAFDADILVGDLLTEIDGVPLTGVASLGPLLQERDGKRISVTLVRNGTRLVKGVQLVQSQ